MNLKQFRKEFSGAPYGVKEFAETVLSHLDIPSRDHLPVDVSRSMAEQREFVAVLDLHITARALLDAEDKFCSLLERNKIDIG
jgi:hypothetical protein